MFTPPHNMHICTHILTTYTHAHTHPQHTHTHPPQRIHACTHTPTIYIRAHTPLSCSPMGTTAAWLSPLSSSTQGPHSSVPLTPRASPTARTQGGLQLYTTLSTLLPSGHFPAGPVESSQAPLPGSQGTLPTTVAIIILRALLGLVFSGLAARMFLGKLRGRDKCPGNSSVLALRSALGTQASEKGDPVEKAGDGCTCGPHSMGG